MKLINTKTGREIRRGGDLYHGTEHLIVTRVDEPFDHAPHGRIWVMHAGRGPETEHVRFPYNFDDLEWQK